MLLWQLQFMFNTSDFRKLYCNKKKIFFDLLWENIRGPVSVHIRCFQSIYRGLNQKRWARDYSLEIMQHGYWFSKCLRHHFCSGYDEIPQSFAQVKSQTSALFVLCFLLKVKIYRKHTLIATQVLSLHVCISIYKLPKNASSDYMYMYHKFIQYQLYL